VAADENDMVEKLATHRSGSVALCRRGRGERSEAEIALADRARIGHYGLSNGADGVEVARAIGPGTATPRPPMGLSMPTMHTVAPGEYLMQIARKYGFTDQRTIWEHPRNTSLRQKRDSPNVLNPGDQVFIPDRELREEARPTDQRHRFKLTLPRLKLRIVLQDMYERPIAAAPCVLTVEGERHPRTTDATGKIEVDIPLTASAGVLIVRTPETAIDDIAIPVRIGDLDDVDVVKGQKQRLANLGYYVGAIDETRNPAFQLAVEEFQCDHGLHVDGDCGPKTQARLKAEHGS
jgi:hypothetical protein